MVESSPAAITQQVRMSVTRLPMLLPIILLHLSGLVLCSGASTFFARDNSHIVDTGYAKFRGNFTEPFSLAFLGVPYAEPPVGDLRFRTPVPLDTDKLRENDAIIDATSYPNFCVQGSIGEGDAGGAGSEDCLKINIYTPVNATARSNCERLFLIHNLFC